MRLSIAGFNDMPYAGMVTPSLTSVDLRARDLGLRTAVLLSELLNGGDPSWALLATASRRQGVDGPGAVTRATSRR